MDVEACLTSGNSYPVTLKVRSPQLTDSGRYLHIDMQLPPESVWIRLVRLPFQALPH
jgi:hypothetical protein